MRFFLILFLISTLACTEKSISTLRCKIPNGAVSFKDSSAVFFTDSNVGYLTVESINDTSLETIIYVNKSIELPINSVLVFHNNLIGDSFFEIVKGSHSRFIENGGNIIFQTKITDTIKGQSNKMIIDTSKLTSPKVIIEKNTGQ